jgi:hypothetical protein
MRLAHLSQGSQEIGVATLDLPTFARLHLRHELMFLKRWRITEAAITLQF